MNLHDDVQEEIAPRSFGARTPRKVATNENSRTEGDAIGNLNKQIQQDNARSGPESSLPREYMSIAARDRMLLLTTKYRWYKTANVLNHMWTRYPAMKVTKRQAKSILDLGSNPLQQRKKEPEKGIRPKTSGKSTISDDDEATESCTGLSNPTTRNFRPASNATRHS